MTVGQYVLYRLFGVLPKSYRRATLPSSLDGPLFKRRLKKEDL